LLAHGIDTAFIDPAKPQQNGTDENFNGKLRDEFLNIKWVRNRPEATIVIEQSRRHYKGVRPHSSLGYLTPQESKAKMRRPQSGDAQSNSVVILQ